MQTDEENCKFPSNCLKRLRLLEESKAEDRQNKQWHTAIIR